MSTVCGVQHSDDQMLIWRSLLSSLESDLNDDDDDNSGAKSNGVITHPSIGQNASETGSSAAAAINISTPGRGGIFGGQIVGVDHKLPFRFGDVGDREPSFPSLTPPRYELLPSLSLLRWIAWHADERYKPNDKWRGVPAHKVSRDYYEASVLIALSLAKNLESRCGGIDAAASSSSCKPIIVSDIAIDRVIVIDTKTGDAYFWGTEPSTTGRESRRALLEAFGRVLFQLFTLGSELPNNPLQPSPELPSAPFSSPSPAPAIGFPLHIHDDDDDEVIRTNDKYATRKQSRKCDELDGKDVASVLKRCGVPSSICRLTVDLLGDADSKNTDPLFRRDDKSLMSISDAVSDLQQMADDPALFLHDYLHGRWKPRFGNKVHGRDQELRRIMEVASRVSPPKQEPSAELPTVIEEEPSNGELRNHQVIMLSGHSGSGKSSMIQKVSGQLQEKGWTILHCKFDGMIHSEPLSILSSAFDRHFVRDLGSSLLDNEGEMSGSDMMYQMSWQISKSIDSDGLDALFKLMPNLRPLIAITDSHYNSTNHIIPIAPNASASKNRLHYLFGLLIKALSTNGNPLLLVMDDLQWADADSIELMCALMEGIGIHSDVGYNDDHKMGADRIKKEVSRAVFVGCYRSNEVGSSNLSPFLQQMETSNNVNMTSIEIQGISSEAVNEMVSEALCFSRRLTRPLSTIVHHKTAGNPLFVIEFLNDLCIENLISFSLSSRTWVWDEDEIETQTVSDSVAKLLLRKLKRLHKKALNILKIVSCLGSEVSMQNLAHVKGVCGGADIFFELDCVVREGLLKKSKQYYCFAHDMLYQVVYKLIMPGDRDRVFKGLVNSMLLETPNVKEVGSNLFLIVDLINRIGIREIIAPEVRIHYAELNLEAGVRAMTAPDFVSAVKYFEAGMSFLDGEYWKEHYRLSLEIFYNAALALSATGKIDSMTKIIDAVFVNAKCFEDKIDCYNILIKSFTVKGKPTETFETGFFVLEKIGETFPSVDDQVIVKEMMAVKESLKDISEESISEFPRMTDHLRLAGMSCMASLIPLISQRKPRYLPLIACRMVRYSLDYGFCKDSIHAFVGLALSLVYVSNKADTGITILREELTRARKWGTFALLLIDSFGAKDLIPTVNMFLYGAMSFWREPIQALFPPLLEAYRDGLKYGNTDFGLFGAHYYINRTFFSGKRLFQVKKEAEVFMRQMNLYKNSISLMCTGPIYSSVCTLTGTVHSVEEDYFYKALNKAENIMCHQIIVVVKTHQYLILRDLDEAGKMVEKYHKFFEDNTDDIPRYLNDIALFYGGLVSFHFFRATKDTRWSERGEDAMRRLELLAGLSSWNFENKFLLLKAELHFSNGEFATAREAYSSAAKAAKDHKFVNEEALAIELAGYFEAENGNHEAAIGLFRSSLEYYTKWGAARKSKLMQCFLNECYDSFNILPSKSTF